MIRSLFSFVILLTISYLTETNESENGSDLKVWRVVSVSDYYGGYMKEEMHKVEGRLPKCELSLKKGKFSSEICMAVQPRDQQETTSVGFQYCDCPRRFRCSRSASLDDPFSYAIIGNTQFKSCLPAHRVPPCSANRHRTVAKIWYGEELPLRIITYCRCPPNFAWGELQCTSNGRICYVLSCESS